MDIELLKPNEVDILLRYPSGKTSRLMRAGKIPYVELPDGGIRVRKDDIEEMIESKNSEHRQRL